MTTTAGGTGAACQANPHENGDYGSWSAHKKPQRRFLTLRQCLFSKPVYTRCATRGGDRSRLPLYSFSLLFLVSKPFDIEDDMHLVDMTDRTDVSTSIGTCHQIVIKIC
ncbi:unnamed protein product [Soboliphyme baturini]|uniref:Uncharacterized protein n=1 Tax=Soboliphyme baturini TaxID=241478 RepID=A0A183IIL8_9BILA|nr:unnamed protein product [Soboliphyme baturini]